MSNDSYPASDESRELMAHCLAVTLHKLDVGDPETQEQFDYMAQDVATMEFNLLRDRTFCPSGILEEAS